MIILCLLIRKKKARVYKPEDFKEYERGSDKNNQSSCFYFASKEIFEYVTLMVLGGREGGGKRKKGKKVGGEGEARKRRRENLSMSNMVEISDVAWRSFILFSS